jgi:hypothetical protein
MLLKKLIAAFVIILIAGGLDYVAGLVAPGVYHKVFRVVAVIMVVLGLLSLFGLWNGFA